MGRLKLPSFKTGGERVAWVTKNPAHRSRSLVNAKDHNERATELAAVF